MEIRYINSSDSLLEISNIYENSWKYAYRNIIPQEYLDSIRTGRWANRITRNGMKNLILIENERIIGTAGFCKSRWDNYCDYGEIVSIYFLPDCIGKGYGQHLLKKCVEELNALGFNKILLWVLEENMRARKFYEKNGFICSEEYLDDNIGGKNLREVMYTISCEKN